MDSSNIMSNSYIENETKSTFLDSANSELDVRMPGVGLCSLTSPHESDTQSLYRYVSFSTSYFCYQF